MRFCGMVALTVLTRKHDETRFWADYTLPSRSDLYLYIGTKEPGATVPSGARDFLSENGLRNGKLFVWVADSGVTRPSQFNANSRITDFDLREGGQLLILGRNGAITRGKKK
jgi:hypothetical protein